MAMLAEAVHRTLWRTLRVQTGDPRLPTTITGYARLIALYQWRRGKPLPGVWVVESTAARASPGVDDVDWALFPAAEAQRELMAHEERCARHLPSRSFAA
jgi:hypothetical protein